MWLSALSILNNASFKCKERAKKKASHKGRQKFKSKENYSLGQTVIEPSCEEISPIGVSFG